MLPVTGSLTMDLTAIALTVILCAVETHGSTIWPSARILTGGNQNIFCPTTALNWNDASLECYKQGAGLMELKNNITNIPASCFDEERPLWIGLAWVNDRLQWMSYKPFEETDLAKITHYAKLRANTSKSCYSINEMKEVNTESCGTKLRFICVRPNHSINPDLTTPHVSTDVIPIPTLGIHGRLSMKYPPFGIKTSKNSLTPDDFNVSCDVATSRTIRNTAYQFRWLVNGAYKPSLYNQRIIFAMDLLDLTKKATRFSLNHIKFFGKISCEILSASTSTTRHSNKVIVISENTVTLRIEFGFINLDLASMMQYFKTNLRDMIPSFALGKNASMAWDEVPFISRASDKKLWFSLYAHFEELSKDDIKRLVAFIRSKEGSRFWLPQSHQINGYKEFEHIEIYVLNYCTDSKENKTEITYAHRLRKRYEEEAYDSNLNTESGCLLASYQCIADWLHPPKWRFINTSQECTKCMAHFEDFKGRCVRVLDPKPFHQSIASCYSEYKKLDHNEASWSMTEFIRLYQMWINERAANRLYWFPIQRKVSMGPLIPVWPWEFQESNGLKKSTSIKVNYEINSISWATNEPDSSLDCVAYDAGNKKLLSVSCYGNLPMVCVRPELKKSDALKDTIAKENSAFHCPTNWSTTLLFPDRDVCYKAFPGNYSTSFDEADHYCKSKGGQLAIARERSTLEALRGLPDLQKSYKGEHVWIGLRKIASQYQWLDGSNLTYQSPADGNNRSSESDYGVSLMVLYQDSPEIYKIWKVWPQNHRLNSYICENRVHPQQDIEMLIDEKTKYSNSVALIYKTLPSKKYAVWSEIVKPNRIRAGKGLKRKTKFQISCYIGNDYVYHKLMDVGNVDELIFQMIRQNGTSDEWLGPQVRCESLDVWSPELVRQSWILPGASSATITSFVVRFRHRNVTYNPLIHDATFAQRDEFCEKTATSLRKLFHEDFLRAYPVYNKTLLRSGTVPLTFQRDSALLSTLTSSYRLVFANATKTEDQIYIDLIKFLKESSLAIEWTDVRPTEFCPGHSTSNRAEFIAFTEDKSIFSRQVDILVWPKTKAGLLATPEQPCIDHKGNLIERQCLGNRITGLYWEPLRNKLSSANGVLCTTDASPLLKHLSELRNETSSVILESMQNELENVAGLTIPDLQAVAYSLESAGKTALKSDLNSMYHLQSIVEKVVNEETLSEAQASSGFSSKMADAVETILLTAAEDFTAELIKSPVMVASILAPKNNSILGYAAAIEEGNITRSTFLLENSNQAEVNRSDVIILLPTELPHDLKVVFAVYPDTRLIDASAAAGNVSSHIYARDPDRSNSWRATEELYAGNGGMAQVKVSSAEVDWAKPLTILFRSKTNLTDDNSSEVQCVFWESRANEGKGGWSAEGCWVDGVLDDLIICRCNHLSTFTLLVSRAEKHLKNTVHGIVLSVFSVLGALLSIAGLMVLVVVFITVRSWRKPLGHRIVFQLSIALILLLITFVGGVSNVSNRIACRLAGVALHYFLLASFVWMTVEAYVQYLFLVKIFDTYVPHLLLKSSLIAWGTPIIPVFTVLVIDSNFYNGNEGYCWLDESAFYPSVVAPLAILLSVNLTVFILIIRSLIITGRNVMRSSLVTSKRNTQKAFAALFNSVLLGLTWIFGFLAVGPVASMIFSYLFCFTTAFQGFFIFLFYVARDPTIKLQVAKCFGRALKVEQNELKSPSSTVTKTFSYSSGKH